MTYNEIIAEVSFNIWGDSNVPAGFVDVMESIFNRKYRQIQQEYNYWFMHGWDTIDSEVGVQSYELPDDFKELITAEWQMLDSEDEAHGFTQPLTYLGLREAQITQWPYDDISESEYPNYCEVVRNTIVVYPDPSEIRTLNITYWRFTDPPTEDEETDLSLYGADALIDLITAQIAAKQKEFDTAQYYSGEYDKDIELLKNEDRRRRQANITGTNYNDF